MRKPKSDTGKRKPQRKLRLSFCPPIGDPITTPPREHWPFDYLIWTLAANPRAPNYLGKRFAGPV